MLNKPRFDGKKKIHPKTGFSPRQSHIFIILNSIEYVCHISYHKLPLSVKWFPLPQKKLEISGLFLALSMIRSHTSTLRKLFSCRLTFLFTSFSSQYSFVSRKNLYNPVLDIVSVLTVPSLHWNDGKNGSVKRCDGVYFLFVLRS